MREITKKLIPKNISLNLWNNFAEEHPLFDYDYTKKEHKNNKELYNQIYNSLDIKREEIEFDYYFDNLKRFYHLAEILLDENIKDIENYIKEMITLSYQMLSSIYSKEYYYIMKDLLKIYDSKNWDYNNAAENQLRYSGVYTFKTSLEHKILRLKSFHEGKKIKVEDEKITDAIKDLINYCMIYLIWSRKGYDTYRDITVTIKG